MNHPDKERFEKIEERLEKLERTRGETEPIQIARIEIDQGGEMRERVALHTEILEKHSGTLDNQTRMLQQIVEMLQNADLPRIHSDVNTLKSEMKEVRADITSIKATQSDHGELLKAMATKNDMAAMETRIIETVKQLLQQKPGE